MYDLLVKLMLMTALLQFGISMSDVGKCHTRTCVQKFEQSSKDVLKINWKPISVFPTEGQRFRESHSSVKQ